MSVQAKNQLSFKKQNVIEQNIPHVGVKSLSFAHEFSSSGESAILFSSLNAPSSWLESGLINPSGVSILSAQLQIFKGNVSVTSSARGLIQKTEYIVKNSGIFFKNITSLANEIFEVSVSDVMVAGKAIADMRTIRVEGTLLDTQTDFAIGYDVDVFDEELVVFRDGIQLFRSDDNDDSGLTGNYHYLDTDNTGRSSVIRFFEPAVGDEPILVISSGGIVDTANVSTFQQIENLAGQIDNVIPTVAALAGVPESSFRAAPNNVDLRQFGQRVVDAESDIASLTNLINNILNVDIPIVTEWQDFPSVAAGTLITSTGSAPSYGSISTNRAQWRRVGSNMEIRWDYAHGTAGGNGTGTYLFNLPPGYLIDLTKVQDTTALSAGTLRGGVGSLFISNNSAATGVIGGGGEVAVYDATRLRAAVFTGGGVTWYRDNWGSNVVIGGFNATVQSLNLRASIPIVGWTATNKIVDII